MKAVFLDRDGTLNHEVGYIRQVEDLHLLPGAAQAVRQLNEAGILAILASNQTGPARGFYDETHVQALHDRLQKLLAEEAQARLDAVFYCPHLSKGSVAEYAIDCECRKPKTGMITQALQRFPDIDLTQSFIVGDKASDVQFAKNAGCRSILVKTGYGSRVLEGKYQVLETTPEFVCEDIAEAVKIIVK